jgi:hypothetical protein
MKKILFRISILLIGLVSMAHSTVPSGMPSEKDILMDQPYYLTIELEHENMVQHLNYVFNSKESMMSFDLNFLEETIKLNDQDEACTLSVTVKVRIGLDSNFVEASVTASGIACGDLVRVTKELREQLLMAIK